MVIYSIFNMLVQRDKYLKGERKILMVDIQLDVTCHCTFCRPLAHKRTPFLGQFYCPQPSPSCHQLSENLECQQVFLQSGMRAQSYVFCSPCSTFQNQTPVGRNDESERRMRGH